MAVNMRIMQEISLVAGSWKKSGNTKICINLNILYTQNWWHEVRNTQIHLETYSHLVWIITHIVFWWQHKLISKTYQFVVGQSEQTSWIFPHWASVHQQSPEFQHSSHHSSQTDRLSPVQNTKLTLRPSAILIILNSFAYLLAGCFNTGQNY